MEKAEGRERKVEGSGGEKYFALYTVTSTPPFLLICLLKAFALYILSVAVEKEVEERGKEVEEKCTLLNTPFPPLHLHY